MLELPSRFSRVHASIYPFGCMLIQWLDIIRVFCEIRVIRNSDTKECSTNFPVCATKRNLKDYGTKDKRKKKKADTQNGYLPVKLKRDVIHTENTTVCYTKHTENSLSCSLYSLETDTVYVSSPT